jgi:IS5 family transposase
VRRLSRRFGRVQAQDSMDGGFASCENLTTHTACDVTDDCFAMKRGLTVAALTSSPGIYVLLRRFRAGRKEGISLLKRVFGLARCSPKASTGYHAYVRTAVLAKNVLLLARASTR